MGFFYYYFFFFSSLLYVVFFFFIIIIIIILLLLSSLSTHQHLFFSSSSLVFFFFFFFLLLLFFCPPRTVQRQQRSLLSPLSFPSYLYKSFKRSHFSQSPKKKTNVAISFLHLLLLRSLALVAIVSAAVEETVHTFPVSLRAARFVLTLPVGVPQDPVVYEIDKFLYRVRRQADHSSIPIAYKIARPVADTKAQTLLQLCLTDTAFLPREPHQGEQCR